MRLRLLAAAVSVVSLLAGCVSPPAAVPVPDPEAPASAGPGDVVVVAVVDVGFDPYHLDFLASGMPQATNADPSDDLPLDESPADWLPGFDASAFASVEALEITLPTSPKDSPAKLHEKDSEAWSGLPKSSPAKPHLRYIPGTKVVGVLDFEGDGAFAASSHGVGTTSVSVGNIHGTCPSCVLLFVNGFSDEAVTWLAGQDWIDVQTNSWGYSKVRGDKVWTDCGSEAQRQGVERGQQIFFSGGNGLLNAFDAPVLTIASCQKGPDWIVAVGANTPDGDSYTGHGKPADIANVGSRYPSAGGATVSSDSTFGGTSNATPVTAGLYAQALYNLRRELEGPSRMQRNGTIAQGPASCGEANPDCALADGELTVHELRQALYDAARLTGRHMAAVSPTLAVPAGTQETEWLNEGHGSFFGHMGKPLDEVALIVAHARGDAHTPETPEEAAFHAAVSYCSQQVWGPWAFGAWKEGDELPAPDPAWPLTAWFVQNCPTTMRAAMDLARLI